jgi:hypothetical protein
MAPKRVRVRNVVKRAAALGPPQEAPGLALEERLTALVPDEIERARLVDVVFDAMLAAGLDADVVRGRDPDPETWEVFRSRLTPEALRLLDLVQADRDSSAADSPPGDSSTPPAQAADEVARDAAGAAEEDVVALVPSPPTPVPDHERHVEDDRAEDELAPTPPAPPGGLPGRRAAT